MTYPWPCVLICLTTLACSHSSAANGVLRLAEWFDGKDVASNHGRIDQGDRDRSQLLIIIKTIGGPSTLEISEKIFQQMQVQSVIPPDMMLPHWSACMAASVAVAV
jgi:hypothetical protein